MVVLGARLGADGGPGPALARRIAHACALCAAAPPGLVVACGAGGEAGAIAAALRAAGVPERAILEEDRSRNTAENARFAARLLRARGFGRALVVTDRHHLPRALAAFRLAGLRAEGSGPPWGPGGRPLRRALVLLREAAALPATAARSLAWRLCDR